MWPWSKDFTRLSFGVYWYLKAELSRSKLYFSFRAEQLVKNKLLWAWAIYAVCSVFPFVLVSSPPRSFFHLNHVRKVRKRCSHSGFSFQVIILGFFDRNVGLCCSCFSVATGQPWLISLSQAMTRGKRSVKRKRRQNSNRPRTIAGSHLSCAPRYSKANLGITHTESLFAG